MLFRSVKMFVACFSFVFFIEMMTGAFGRGAFTTIERQFQVTTKKMASLSVAYQLANLLCLIIISYYGKTCHRPRIVGASCMLLSFAFFFTTVPHFVSDNYNYTEIITNTSSTKSDSRLCSISNTTKPMPMTSQCGTVDVTTESGISGLFWMVVVGYVLSGAGGSTFYPLAFSYVDDAADEARSSLYVAIINTMGLLGNVCGYALSGIVLNLWVDFERIDADRVDLQHEDPRWIGAWWFGFALGGILIFFFTLALFFFPKTIGRMKRKEKKAKEETRETQDETNSLNPKTEPEKSNQSFSNLCKGPLLTSKRMFTKPVFVFTLISGTLSASAQLAIILYSPKYFELNFGISASRTGFIFGVVILPCSGIAMMLSGVIMKKMKLRRRGALVMCTASLTVASLSLLLLCFVGCDTIDIKGVTTTYSGQNASSPTDECNMLCGCEVGSFSPVCGSDGKTYLTSCFAGCEEMSGKQFHQQNFTSCGCVGGNSTATSGACEQSKCPHLLSLVVALHAIAVFFGSMVTTPFMMIVFRTVPVEDKSVGIGISAFMLRVAGLIPSRIILAAIVDNTCLYWSGKSCAEDGYCKIYDNAAMRKSMFGFLFVYQIISAVTIALALLFERRERKTLLKLEH